MLNHKYSVPNLDTLQGMLEVNPETSCKSTFCKRSGTGNREQGTGKTWKCSLFPVKSSRLLQEVPDIPGSSCFASKELCAWLKNFNGEQGIGNREQGLSVTGDLSPRQDLPPIDGGIKPIGGERERTDKLLPVARSLFPLPLAQPLVEKGVEAAKFVKQPVEASLAQDFRVLFRIERSLISGGKN